MATRRTGQARTQDGRVWPVAYVLVRRVDRPHLEMRVAKGAWVRWYAGTGRYEVWDGARWARGGADAPAGRE